MSAPVDKYARMDALMHFGNPTGSYARVKGFLRDRPVPSVDPATPKPDGHVRIVCISDTHGYHPKVPAGDILIHAGDLTNKGEPAQVESFVKWFASQPHTHKVFIAGNHDLTLHAEYYEKNWSRFHRKKEDPAAVRALLAHPGVIYLEDSGVELMGLKFYGSPWQPEFFDWAYNLPRGEECAVMWRSIPTDTDILITHGPPLGYGDLCTSDQRAGCVDLLKEVQRRVKPKFHIFGHIHEAYGASSDGVTTYVNASTCTLRYKPTNPPMVFDVRVGGDDAERRVADGVETPSAEGDAPAAASGSGDA